MIDTTDMTDTLATIKIDDFLKKPVNMLECERSIECKKEDYYGSKLVL